MKTERGLSLDAFFFILAIVLIIAVAAGLPILRGDRTDAQAQRTVAQAEAYQVRQAADSAAAAERAAIRQAQRDASHERTIELLPWALLIVVGGLVAVLLLILFLDRRRPPSADPTLLAALHQIQLADQRRNLELWTAIAALSRPKGVPERSGVDAIRPDPPSPSTTTCPALHDLLQ